MNIIENLYLIQTLACLSVAKSGINVVVLISNTTEDMDDLVLALDYSKLGITDVNLIRLFVDINSPYHITNQFCQKIHTTPVDAVMVFGPESKIRDIKSFTHDVKLPLFLPNSMGNLPDGGSDFQIHMTPSHVGAMVDIAAWFSWEKIYYVYDSDEGFYRMKEFSETTWSSKRRRDVAIIARRITNITDSYDLLRSIDRADTINLISKPKRIILDLSTYQAYNETLEQIINVGMNRDTYHYILGSLGITELDLTSFLFGGVNITGFSIINNASNRYKRLKKDSHSNRMFMNIVPTFHQGLVVDNMMLIQEGCAHNNCQQYTRGCTLPKYRPRNKDRDVIMNNIKRTSMDADKTLTGTLKFDMKGKRKDYTLNVYQQEYKKNLRKVGTWSPNGGNFTQRFQTNLPEPPIDEETLVEENKQLRVVTILESPFVQYVQSTSDKDSESGNTHPYTINGRPIEGYCIDVAEKVKLYYKKRFSETLNFTFHLVKDSDYGKVTQNSTWNGMVGELINGDADLAIASLTINKERERVVDFTKPFMKIGISIMIKKPEKQKPGVFSFMSPLSNRVWLCVMVAFLAVSLVLFFVGRWSPFEWQTTGQYSKDPRLVNAFTFSNALWFALGALMQQGSDIFPRSISGRIVGSAWWFFTLILISSYTANLAAFLTIERLVTNIKSADDLAAQTKIQYGSLRGGSTQSFFQQSKVSVYRQMWRYMQSNYDKVMVGQNQDGIRKVRESKGQYAFLVESPLNNYENQKKPCNTMKVGDNLDSKGYGIATPLNSRLRKNLNIVVLELREYGEFHKLEQKWWYDKGECGAIESKDGKKNALTLSNVSGIFHILIGGLVFSMTAALFEYLVHKHRKALKEQKAVRKNGKTYYRPTTVKIVKKDPLEALKSAGYTQHENSGI